MNNIMVRYRNREWDTEFFGLNVAEIDTDPAGATDLETALKELQADGISLVYWRVGADDEESSRAAEQCGGFFAGCQVTYQREGANGSSGDGLLPGITRYNGQTANAALKRLAIQSGQHSRFKNDLRFIDDQFVGLYLTWIEKCASGELADEVLISEHDNQISGMVAIKRKGEMQSIVLISVEEKFRGQGIGNQLVKSALSEGSVRGASSHTVVTYRENIAACKLFEKHGYEPRSFQKYYHFWL